MERHAAPRQRLRYRCLVTASTREYRCDCLRWRRSRTSDQLTQRAILVQQAALRGADVAIGQEPSECRWQSNLLEHHAILGLGKTLRAHCFPD